MSKFFHDRPWIWLVLLLVCMMAGSITFVVIAERNAPQSVPLDHPESEQQAQ